MKERTKDVRNLLRKAFREVPGAFSPEHMSHQFCLEMRGHLHLLQPEDLQSILPGMLEDLLDSHTGTSLNSADIEFVVSHLNVLSFTSEETYARIAEHMGEASATDSRETDVELRSAKLEQYQHFTPDQARAIYEWLTLARTWEDLAWYLEDTDAAIDYWRDRSLRTGAERSE
jgi:hypothetical protein